MKDPQATISRVLSFIRGDLQEIALPKDRSPRSSFPAILTCFSGMDFLGALLFQRPGNEARTRIRLFLEGPMAQEDNRYGTIAADLYEMLRKPLVHCGAMAGYFMVESDEELHAKHLMREGRGAREYVVLHTATFVKHFLAAAEAAEGELHSRSAGELARTLDLILPDLYKNPPLTFPIVRQMSPPVTPPSTSWSTQPRPKNTKGTTPDDTPGWR
jgi:hypothetical protein